MNEPYKTSTFLLLLLVATLMLASLTGSIFASTFPDRDGERLPAGLTSEDWQSLRAQIRAARQVTPASSGSTSQATYLKASNTDAGDQFGLAVAVSGDTVVVGAPDEDSSATTVNGFEGDDSAVSAGAAYVFVRDGAGWSQQAYLKASNAEATDAFGHSVAISGDTIVVGAWFERGNGLGIIPDPDNNSTFKAGAAYVFTRSGTVWSQEAYLKASNPDPYDWLGASVAISGDTIVVGAYGEDSSATGVDGAEGNSSAGSVSGAAYVFDRFGSVWSQSAYLKASNTGVGDRFGSAVAIADDTIVIGAPVERSGSSGVNGNQSDDSAAGAGAAYVFTRIGGSWVQEAYLKASNPDATDVFGTSVAVSGDTVVVGAPGEDSDATGVDGGQGNSSSFGAGAAYVFRRGGGSWSQEAYLKASNTGYGDAFGASVAISGDLIAVGASREGSKATGIDGDQGDGGRLGDESGAVYVFGRSGVTWSQAAYVKASNTNAYDLLGQSVSLSGKILVAGAVGEDSSATGVNGDPGNDYTNGSYSGAAYLYDLEIPSPGE